jgi:hypothetical protein
MKAGTHKKVDMFEYKTSSAVVKKEPEQLMPLGFRLLSP